MKKKIARFEVKDILPIGLTLVVTGIAIAYGLNVMSDNAEDMCDGTNEHYNGGNCYVCNSTVPYFNTSNSACMNSTTAGEEITRYFTLGEGGDASFNASKDAVTGVAKLPEKLPLIVNVIVAAIIIGILIRYLMVRFG